MPDIVTGGAEPTYKEEEVAEVVCRQYVINEETSVTEVDEQKAACQ